MHLPDGSRSDGLGIEFGKDLVGRLSAQFLAQTNLQLGKRPGRHAILQGLQLLAEGQRQKIRHHADQLANLDEQALEIDDGGKNAPGIPSVNLVGQSGGVLGAHQTAAQRKKGIRQDDLHGHEIGTHQPTKGPAVNCGSRSAGRRGSSHGLASISRGGNRCTPCSPGGPLC